jgi:hypothetical protein
VREGGRKNIILLEGSQATPARPPGKNDVKVKTFVIGGGFRLTAETYALDRAATCKNIPYLKEKTTHHHCRVQLVHGL